MAGPRHKMKIDILLSVALIFIEISLPVIALEPTTLGQPQTHSSSSSSMLMTVGPSQQQPRNRRGQPQMRAALPQPLALQQTGSQQQPHLVRTVNPGDRVNIPCSLANMGGSIQFAKDEQPIILDSGCAHCQLDISNDGQASLTINRVSQRDAGHWQCWRLDANGKVKQKIPIIQLVITNSPELPILIVNDKELLGGNNLDATITVKENELVNFKCLIKGAASPVDYVHWMLDSSQNITHSSELRMEFSPQENNYITQSTLKLNATKSMNLKSISCLSNHQLWLTPMTVTAFLNVLYEPSFTISREPGFGIPVSEGMTVILKCEIDSNPSSTPIWIKDADNKTASAANQALSSGQSVTGKEAIGEPILLDTQEDGSVIFQPAQRSDSGWYRCKTENRYGNFSSFGYYLNVRPAADPLQQPMQAPRVAPNLRPPAPESPNQQLAAPFQQQAYQRVMAPNQVVRQSGSQLPSNDQPAGQQFSSALAGSELQQSKCKPRPDGFPEIEQPVSTVMAVLGRQLIIPLRFCCNPGPARVFWIHRHLAMIPGRMFGPYITRDIYTTYNSFNCYESTFEIEAVKPEDIGTVYVFISNERGHAGAQIHIQLSKVSQITNTFNDHPANNLMGQRHGQPLGARFQIVGSSASGLFSRPTGNAAICLMMSLVIAASALVCRLQFGLRVATMAPLTIANDNR